VQVGDCITSIDGMSLQQLELEDCELAFVEGFRDGVEISVESHCEIFGALPDVSVDWGILQEDLTCFAEDYQVDLRITKDRRSVQLSGVLSAVEQAREDATALLRVYFPS